MWAFVIICVVNQCALSAAAADLPKNAFALTFDAFRETETLRNVGVYP